MEYWEETLLIALLIAIFTPVLFSIFWFSKIRGEKKISEEDTIRTRPPKALSGFFLGFALLVLIGGIVGIIYCCVTDAENTTVSIVVVLSVFIAVFSGLGFFGYAYIRFNYVVADAEGIYVYRLFRKNSYYRYEEIAYFEDTISMGVYGGLKAFDKDNKRLFAIEALHIGSSAVAQRLREHGVHEKLQIQVNLKR